MVNRCRWVPTNNKLYCDYHDKEWGKPIGDDQKLFELLCLESYQSGLSWLTVLNKRQAFNRVFHDYDIERIYRDVRVLRILDGATEIHKRLISKWMGVR